jgi:very-short-patch-repair endonuclease
MLVGEADGLGKYDTPGSLAAEKIRQQAMEELGYGFVRWTAEQMRFRPSSVLARIASALEARAPR